MFHNLGFTVLLVHTGDERKRMSFDFCEDEAATDTMKTFEKQHEQTDILINVGSSQ